jgi:exonuclease SbcC
LKLLHSADLHFKPETADLAFQSLDVMAETGRRESVDLFILAGDLTDCIIRNTEGSRFPEYLEKVRRLADIAPLVMIYGTPTHDAAGSLDVFPTLESRFGITILEPGKAYFLTKHYASEGSAFNDVREEHRPDALALLFGVPEPSKKFLAPYFDGKSETEQAVRAGLQGLFMGLGAIRKQYPALPCILVYHGQVGGARLQNGELLDNGAGIRPSIDDLAAVGADYIALGDIHEPQQVGKLPAYYPGSAYPINFGETHEAGCNLVELSMPHPDKVWCHYVTRVPFGHPVNRKISARWPSLYASSQITPGANTWLEITCTKEESASVDVEKMVLKLFMDGVGPGSRVTLNVLPTETVRAGEIASKTKLRDKVTLWAENSSKELAATVLEKADQVEAEAAASGAVGRGDKIRLTRLILRGAIGLWKKSGLEEIDLNLETIDPGLVALIGNNGAGKTTILENMHPWPSLLTRDGVLKDHFRLRDSFRDLYWTDESTGWKYRALITVNAAIASGTTEYFLYVDKGNGPQPLPGIEGRKEGYVEAVNKIFGSLDLYLKSAFVTQRQPKGIPDIADATPRERKVLFSALCGLEYFEVYKKLAKERGDQVDARAAIKATEISTLEARLPNEYELGQALGAASGELATAKEDLQVLAEVGKHHSAKADALGAQATANRQKAQQAEDAHVAAANAGARIQLAREGITRAEEALGRKAQAEATIQEHTEKTQALAAEDAAYRKHLEAVADERKVVDGLRETHDAGNRKILADFETVRAQHETKVREARNAENEAQATLSNGIHELFACRKEVERLTSELAVPVADHCPTCRQMLPQEALSHVQEARKVLVDKLAEAKQDVSRVLDSQEKRGEAARLKTLARNDLEAQAPKAPTLAAFVPPPSQVPAFDVSRRTALQSALDFIDVDGARATITAADQAQVRIEELTKQLADLQATAERERKREAELRAELRPELDAELAEAQRSLEATRTAYRDAQGREARAAAALEQAQRRLEELSKDRQAVDALKTALAGLQAEVAEWKTLELACSDKGIQALELDAVAPSIGAIANALLRGAFGSRYQLEFDTQRLSGTGKTQKLIEDFLIYVLDSETGERQEISTLSGGEAVWIRRALYDAFGVIRARSTGLQFLTAFQDEADGALDPEARLTYYRMLVAAHEQSGRSHTIIITHSSDLQELIPNRVEVTKLKGRPDKEAAA